VRDHLAVGFAFERASLGKQFVAQRLVVLDDAVVDQRDFVRRVRVRVAGRGGAVRRPAGVGYADGAGRGMRGELAHEIGQLALSAAADHLAAGECAGARAVVATVFHPPEPVDKAVRDGLLADDADDAAHFNLILKEIRRPPNHS